MSDPASSPLTTRHPASIIAREGAQEITVEALLSQARILADKLPDRPYAINLSTNRLSFLIGFCAAVMAGQCTLMPPNRQRNTLLRAAADYGGSYVLGGTPVDGLEYVPIEASAEGGGTVASPLIPDEQLCAIVFTSGSTGESQPNRKYWKTLRAGALSNAELVLDSPSGTLSLVATVPAQHMWGFEMSILLPLFSPVAVSARTPFFPQDIVEAITELPRPRGLISSPIHLGALLDAGGEAVEIDWIFSATAPMSAELARRLEERFRANFMDVFGCSETGIFAARRRAFEEDWHLARAFSLRSEGKHTQILADHIDDRVRLSDRVQLLSGGRFRWIGRDEDMINIAGKRGSLADINQRLNAVPGVSDGVIFMPDANAARLAALVVAPSLKPSDILAGLRDSIEPAFLPRPVYMVSALPRQETGKLLRKAVLELFNELRRKRTTSDHDDEEHSSAE